MDISSLPKLSAFHQYTAVYIDPTKLDAFWKAFQPVFYQTAAAPECLYFEVFVDPAVPGKVAWIVNWNASVEWVMTVHLSKDYYKPYLAATEPLFVKEREVGIWKRKEPYRAAKKANFEVGPMEKGISLQIMVHVKPENVEDFWKEWDKLFEVVAGEKECLYFDVFEDPLVPGRICWVENWNQDVDWFWREQITKDYYKPYLAATEAMFAKDREVQILQRKDNMVAYKPENFSGAKIGDYGVEK